MCAPVENGKLREKVESLLQNYSVGNLISFSATGGGTANLNLVIRTESGKFFLRRRNPKYCSPEQISFDHRLMEHLSARGIPGPLPLKTKSGATFVRSGGEIFELHRFIEGEQHDRNSADQIRIAGVMLARFHIATRDFDTRGEKKLPRLDSPDLIREGIREASENLPADEKELVRYLLFETSLIEGALPDALYWNLPSFVIHGDYHPANILFRGGEIVGIFDLDWASSQPRCRDIADGLMFFAARRESDIDGADIFSLTQAMQFDVERMRIFLDGYRELLPISPLEIEALPAFMRARWLYCRVSGMAKVPPEKRTEYFFDSITKPLRWLDENAELFTESRF